MSCRTDREMPLYSSWIELIAKNRRDIETRIYKMEDDDDDVCSHCCKGYLRKARRVDGVVRLFCAYCNKLLME